MHTQYILTNWRDQCLCVTRQQISQLFSALVSTISKIRDNYFNQSKNVGQIFKVEYGEVLLMNILDYIHT